MKISEETPQLLLKYQQQKTQLPKSKSKVRSYDCTHAIATHVFARVSFEGFKPDASGEWG